MTCIRLKNFYSGDFDNNKFFFDLGETINEREFNLNTFIETIRPIDINNEEILLIAVGRNEKKSCLHFLIITEILELHNSLYR